VTKPKPKVPTNPWDLTQAELRAMLAVIEHGTVKGAAWALKLSWHTLQQQSWRARAKVREHTREHCIAVIDRWHRAQQQEATPT
jgi:hypothetical protein